MAVLSAGVFLREFPLAAAGIWVFLVSVRGWLSWLLVFGVIAGLGGRVLALGHWHPPDQLEHCCGHDHGHPPTDDHSRDGYPPGPHDHHHTHACCHSAPLMGGEFQHQRMVPPGHTWLRVFWLTALPPDEPVFTLDKPPLI